MSDKETFLTIKPENEILRPYISYYYFHQSFEETFQKYYTFYPNYKHAITVYNKSKVDFTTKTVVPIEENNLTQFFTMNYDQNFRVSLNGIFNKIGIVFNPLAINHFIDKPLNEIYDFEHLTFDHFGKEFEEVLYKIYATNHVEEKRTILDNFFIKKIIGFEPKFLLDCVNDIIKSNGTVKVETLSERYSIHRKSLLRLFQKHFCCTLETYKKMVKFRNTLNYTQTQENTNTLTEVSLYNHYYDQADFNKQFKTITKFTPKELLSKISKIGNEDTYWVFEE